MRIVTAPFRRKTLAIYLIIATLFFSSAVPANAGISIDILSFGPFSIGIDIPFEFAIPFVALIAVGSLFLSYLTCDGSNCEATYPGADREEVFTVSVQPETRMPGRVIRIKYSQLVKNNRIGLSSGASLEVQDDGKLIFQGAGIDGYALLNYKKELSVWSKSGELILAVVPIPGQRTLILQEHSARSNRVLNIFFPNYRRDAL